MVFWQVQNGQNPKPSTLLQIEPFTLLAPYNEPNPFSLALWSFGRSKTDKIPNPQPYYRLSLLHFLPLIMNRTRLALLYGLWQVQNGQNPKPSTLLQIEPFTLLAPYNEPNPFSLALWSFGRSKTDKIPNPQPYYRLSLLHFLPLIINRTPLALLYGLLAGPKRTKSQTLNPTTD